MIAERLREAREKKGITQFDAAAKVGISHVALGYFERGVKMPSIAVLIELARLYGVSLDYLCGNDGTQAN